MNEDRLLRDLADQARRDEAAGPARLDERWGRLAAGTLTAGEDAELRALAEASPEHREAYEAFRPFGADFQARVLSAIQTERGGEIAQKAAPPEPRPRVLPFRRAVRRASVWLGSAAAVAAGVFFFLVRGPVLPTLPAYTIDPLSGDKSSRGGEAGPVSGTPVYSPGSKLELFVHPRQPQSVHGPLNAQAFREVPSRGGKVEWEPVPGFTSDLGEDGRLRLRGTLGEMIRLPLGTWRICVVVSRPGKAPPERELLAAPQEGNASWQAACTEPLRIEDHAPI
jgi:hypothetical protein